MSFYDYEHIATDASFWRYRWLGITWKISTLCGRKVRHGDPEPSTEPPPICPACASKAGWSEEFLAGLPN